MKYGTILKRLPKGIRKAAKAAGISPTTIARLNRGEPPDPRTIARLMDWAGVDSITLTRTDLEKAPAHD